MMRQISFRAELHSLARSLVSLALQTASVMYVRPNAIATIANTSEFSVFEHFLDWTCDCYDILCNSLI